MAQACVIETGYDSYPGLSDVTFRISVSEESRSKGTDSIDSINVYIFRDGTLEKHISEDTAGSFSIALESGEYAIYAIANSGQLAAIMTEKEICSLAIRRDMFEEGTLMCWNDRISIASGARTDVEIRLERLAAEIEMSLDKEMMQGLDIISMEICQSAGVLRPFADGGSRIMSAEEADSGHMVSESELESLMCGGSINVRVPENCQGKLLEGNDDPWKKVPENIGDAAGMCTYIEMKGRWKEDAPYKGEITYRFFLGEDATSSFDIRRNTRQAITLCPEEENFGRDSWKVDTSEMKARYSGVQVLISEDNRVLVTADRPLKAVVSIAVRLFGHIRCVTVQDPFFTVWGHYFKEEAVVEGTEEVRLDRTPVTVCEGLADRALERLRSVNLYSVLDAWDIEDFMYPANSYGTIREYLKPYGARITISISSHETEIRDIAMDGQLTYEHTVSDPVTWPVSLFSYWTTVPSTDSRFDRKLEDDDCPQGSIFKEGEIKMTPEFIRGQHIIQQP